MVTNPVVASPVPLEGVGGRILEGTRVLGVCSDVGMPVGNNVEISVITEEPPDGPDGTPDPVGVGGKIPELSVVESPVGVAEGVSLGVKVGVSVAMGGTPDEPVGVGSTVAIGPVPEDKMPVLLKIGGRSLGRLEMPLGSPDGGAVGPGTKSEIPERVGIGNDEIRVEINGIPSVLLSEVGMGRPTLGVGVSEIPKAVVMPTKMPVPVVGIGSGASVEVSTTLEGTTTLGTPPVEPTGNWEESEGVGSGNGKSSEMEGWITVSGRPPVEPGGGRINGPIMEEVTGVGSPAADVDGVGVTTESGTPPVVPTAEVVGRAGPGMTIGVSEGWTMDDGRPPVEPTTGGIISAAEDTAALELGAGRSTAAEVG